MDKSTKPTKQTLQQSIDDLLTSVRDLGTKLMPHIGFIHLVIVLAGITAIVYMVSQTMQSTDVGAGTATNEKINEYTIPFDQATITKIKALSNNTGSPSVALPHGRINPFSESVY